MEHVGQQLFEELFEIPEKFDFMLLGLTGHQSALLYDQVVIFHFLLELLEQALLLASEGQLIGVALLLMDFKFGHFFGIESVPV
jgi:hypothetical protein